MGWLSWLRRKPRACDDPTLVVRLVEGSNLVITADWPELETVEQKAGMGQAMATVLFFLSDGRLLPRVQQAVAVAGRMKGDERMSAHILECLNGLLTKNGSVRRGVAQNGPLVPADEAFEKG